MEKIDNGAWFIEKVLPSVFAALTIGAIFSGFATYHSVQALSSRIEHHEKELISLKVRIEAVSSTSVTRTELLETLKRVELQLHLVMAEAGVRKKIRIE